MRPSGTMNKRLELRKPGQTVTSGRAALPWPLQDTVWGSVEGLSGTDRTGMVADAVYRVRIRYRTDIDRTWQIVVLGDVPRTLQIVAPPMDPDGRQRELEIVAQELAA